MKFARLTIHDADSEGKKKVITEAMFNPNKFTIEDSSKWENHKTPRLYPELQYVGGERKTLSMELFFDTLEINQDVRIYTGKIARLLIVTIDGRDQGKRPPKVRLSWGKADPNGTNGIFSRDWVLEKLTQNFTMFRSTGEPVRATLNVTFKEFVIPIEEAKKNPKESSFPPKTYTVKRDDKLTDIAFKMWKDPEKWRILAKENNIINPRRLKTGQTLFIPAIQ